ncbi:MAG: hypothetical protein HBSAPP02_21290 [Phycisphaerae bacterium]|nr:MAG: hypothetical protein HBSAPP02_21290 [Phycisphaerae bacterium]
MVSSRSYTARGIDVGSPDVLRDGRSFYKDVEMKVFGWTKRLAFLGVVLSATSVGVRAEGPAANEKRYGLTTGTALLELNAGAMGALGVTFPVETRADGNVGMQFNVNGAASSFQLARVDGASAGLYGVLATEGTGKWTISTDAGRQTVNVGDFLIGFAGRHGHVSDAQDLHLEVLSVSPESVTVDFDGAFGTITVRGELVVSEQFAANVLNQSGMAGRFVGHLTIQGMSREAMEPSEPDSEAGLRAPGPDVTVGELRGNGDSPGTQPSNWGTNGGYVAYSFGTTSCNVGTNPLWWYTFGAANPSWHPVINQGLYRYKVVDGSGRFEMLGQAWLKHGFCALQGTVCSACSPYCGGCCDNLGVGCSDPYTASRNGDRTGMGPKSQINAATGQILVWPYPTSNPPSNSTLGRCRVLISDIDPAQNAGAAYYAEGMYVSQDDAGAGNDNNNASYRRCQFGASGSYPMTWFSTLAGQTVRQQAAINAWKVHDPAVQIVHVDVINDGRFTIGYRVTDLSGVGNGPWHYEYAVFNMNSDRSASSISIPLPAGSVVTNTGFHDVEYHNGDGATIGINFDGSDWPATVTPGTSISWNMPVASPAANSNALRWGTLYNYRFDADSPPVEGLMTIGLYKAGTPTSVVADVLVPSVPTCDCPGDLDNSGVVDGGDVALFTQMYIGSISTSACAQVEKPESGPLDSADVDMFVSLLLNVTPCN